MSKTKEEWLAERQEHAEALHRAWDEMPDWWGVCRKCGAKVTGTPTGVVGHKCEVPNG